jgi:hypothetical protein
MDEASLLTVLKKNLALAQARDRFPIILKNIGGIASVGAFKHVPATPRKAKDDVVTEPTNADRDEIGPVSGYRSNSLGGRSSVILRQPSKIIFQCRSCALKWVLAWR